MTVQKTATDYHSLAKERNLRWLGPPVDTTKSKTGWQCNICQHQWKTRFSIIRRGSGCPQCARMKQRRKGGVQSRLRAPDYFRLAELRGIVWLGPVVSNVHMPTKWQCLRCADNHVWSASYHTISLGSGCPQCARNSLRLDPKAYHDLAKNRLFIWLGPGVSNTHTKTGWQCQRGHAWSTTYSNIRSGFGCPHCYRSRRSANK